jgi:hypothetical protein
MDRLGDYAVFPLKNGSRERTFAGKAMEAYLFTFSTRSWKLTGKIKIVVDLEIDAEVNAVSIAEQNRQRWLGHGTLKLRNPFVRKNVGCIQAMEKFGEKFGL